LTHAHDYLKALSLPTEQSGHLARGVCGATGLFYHINCFHCLTIVNRGIEMSGRETSVVLSKHRYDQLCELEDMFWDLKAQAAENEGFTSDFEVKELLQARD
jgi:predicted DNA-binding ribbon-helix-helix protein